jgi:hypothetical protein
LPPLGVVWSNREMGRTRQREAGPNRSRGEQGSAPEDSAVQRVLALQGQAGNRAVAAALADRTVLARQPVHAPAPAERPPAPQPGEVLTREVDRAITETISHAPAAYSQWNGTYSWRAKWQLQLDLRAEIGELAVVVRLHSTASAAQKRAWSRAIRRKWSDKFAFCVLRDTPVVIGPGVTDDLEEMYPIRIKINWVNDARRAHYVIRPNAPGAAEGGRAGQGGTTSMTGWGTADTVDITHEFGHMLGCPEEYFTTNGVDYTYGGRRQGFRDRRGGVMNNPAGPALARNFALIRREAARLRRVPLRKTAIQPWL